MEEDRERDSPVLPDPSEVLLLTPASRAAVDGAFVCMSERGCLSTKSLVGGIPGAQHPPQHLTNIEVTDVGM